MALLIVFSFSIFLWYVVYGAELALNGASMKPFTHIRCLYEELMWVLPGGFQRRVAYCRKLRCKDESEILYLAKSLPGMGHFIFMHLAFPFLPTILLYMVQ